jgi:ABC-type phosphate transport system substrate-binding protein
MKLVRNIATLCFLAVAPLGASEIRMAISDLLAETLDEPLQTFRERSGTNLLIDDIGSLPAIDRLRSDEIDLAIVALPDEQSAPGDEFRVLPFAYETAVIAVNEANPMNELNLAFLGGIFGADEEFSFNTWGEMGLPGWGTRNIKPAAATAEQSIALELFKYTVFEGTAMKPGVAMLRDSEVEDFLRADAASVAILSRAPEGEGIKVLMVSQGGDAPAFGPTEDNVHFGDYPIRLGFHLAFNPGDMEKLKPIIRELLGDVVADELRADGFVALPETVRRKLLIDLNLD